MTGEVMFSGFVGHPTGVKVAEKPYVDLCGQPVKPMAACFYRKLVCDDDRWDSQPNTIAVIGNDTVKWQCPLLTLQPPVFVPDCTKYAG